MINTHTLTGETWIDVENGTPEEIRSLMDAYGIHPFVARDLSTATPRPRIEFHDGYVYCILHFPVYKHTHKDGKSQEVDFIIGKNLLITSRYDTIDAIHKFSKTIEVEEIIGEEASRNGLLFANLLSGLYNSLMEELEAIEDETDEITSQIFKGREREMVFRISEITRTLLDFKKITDLHREMLESLRHRGEAMFGEDFGKRMEGILLEYTKINSMVRSELDMLRELRDTNDSLLTSKQNETVRQLTVISFIILPLNLIAFIFAMRTEGMPIVTNPNAFWMVLGIMLTAAAIQFVWAKHSKWM